MRGRPARRRKRVSTGLGRGRSSAELEETARARGRRGTATHCVARAVVGDAERDDDRVVEEAVVEAEPVPGRRVVPRHRDGEDRVGLVRAAVSERARDREVVVRLGDVPGDDVSDVVQVGLCRGRGEQVSVGDEREGGRERGRGRTSGWYLTWMMPNRTVLCTSGLHSPRLQSVARRRGVAWWRWTRFMSGPSSSVRQLCDGAKGSSGRSVRFGVYL